ncbi:MAG: 6-carboxytetrahydropterin synthase [Acidobacteriota bacterium]
MGFFRIAKTFEVEYGHRLSKHPEKCRFPHGHSLRIEVVARGCELDDHDMVCDYKALKMVVIDVVERLDHAMALNSADPQLEGLTAIGDRVLIFDDCDPTTEVLARWIYEQMAERIAADGSVESPSGTSYEIPAAQ